MPHDRVLLQILRAAVPAAVRIIACTTLLLGRPPLSHREAGVSRASWYRHRDDAQALVGRVSQSEKNQADAPSLPETKMHRAVDNSGCFPTGLASQKTSCAQALERQSPRKVEFSTGQKKRSSDGSQKKGSTDAPSCRTWGDDVAPVVRAVKEQMRRSWLRARQRNPDIRFLSLGSEALADLERRLRSDGAPRVVAVVDSALCDAVAGKIPRVFYERIFSGQGYDARARALDLAELQRRQIEHIRATKGQLTDVERRLLAMVHPVTRVGKVASA